MLFFNHILTPSLLGVAGLVLAGTALPAPRVPAEDATVLERLPARRDDRASAELRALRQAAACPADPGPAARLGRHLYGLAAKDGDPRYVGYAEAAIAPWLKGEPPIEVRYVRGLLRQYRHDFDGALGDFAAVLAVDPTHFGARAWRAAIYMVRAQYAEASAECAALPGRREALYATGCRAYADAATGRTRAAYAELERALQRDMTATDGEKFWALTRLAEMAWRLEDTAAADRLFRRALALERDDNFLLAAYADFMLERGRHRDVVALLRGRERSDALLLRLALAEQALGAPSASTHARSLGERFAAAALRGERLHLAEEARYRLDLRDDARGALALALENWTEQREPRDALIVLRAAAAARNAAAADPVLKWLQESGFEDPRMRRLAATLK
jgi:Tfp pilus assembly protein PilF